uniref:hypothetical protein n=1 Tax=Flavobacterium sp. TaxID=239 RepID=UPI00262434B0
AGGGGGSTVQKMVNAINSLSDEQRALLPPPDVLLQLLLAEVNPGGDWEGMLDRANGGEEDPPTDFKKLFSSKLKKVGRFIEKISDWGSNFGTAGNMFIDWVKGTGADKIYYIEDRVADSMRNAYAVEEAREFYYKKYKNRKNLKVTSVTNRAICG